jgi:hypothetical protein
MATLAKTTRSTSYTLASPSAGPFLLGYRLFDDDAVEVYVDGVRRFDWTGSRAYANGFDDNASITFFSALPTGSKIVLETMLRPNRSANYTPADPSLVSNLNIELARIWSTLGDHDREIKRSARVLGVEQPKITPEEGFFLQFGSDGTLTPAALLSGGITATAYAETLLAAPNAASARTVLGVTSPIVTDLVVNIPSDFPTLQAAVDAYSTLPVENGHEIELRIATGHALTAPLLVENGDFGKFRITSVDATVNLAAGWTATDYVMKAVNARAPIWDIFLDLIGKTVTYAIHIENGSHLQIGSTGKGARNGAGTGLFVYQASSVVGLQSSFRDFTFRNAWITHVSDAWLERGNFTGAGGDIGVFISRNSRLYAAGSDFSNCANTAVQFRRSFGTLFGQITNTTINNAGGAGAALEVLQNSVVHADIRSGLGLVINGAAGNAVAVDQHGELSCDGITIDNPTFDGFRVFGGARLRAPNATLTNIGRDAFVVRNAAEVEATGVTANSVAGRGVVAETGSRVCVDSGSFTNAGGAAAILATTGATVNADDVTVNSAAGVGLFADFGGKIVARSASGTGCATGVRADHGGEVICPDSVFTGATVEGCRATSGSRISADSTNFRRGGGDAVTDIVCGSGSQIAVVGGTGGTSITVNTISGSSGIIFK